MAQDLANAEGIVADSNYPTGYKIVDGQTVINSHINQDIIQFFQKMMDVAGITPNGQDDNEVNDYQFLEALKYYVIRHVNYNFNYLFYKKVLAVQTWNMDTTATVQVNHGLTTQEVGNISRVTILIFNDIVGVYTIKKPFDFLSEISSSNRPTITISSTPQTVDVPITVNGIYEFSSTKITLQRTAGGDFDNSGFSGTVNPPSNRAIIVIDYFPDVYVP